MSRTPSRAAGLLVAVLLSITGPLAVMAEAQAASASALVTTRTAISPIRATPGGQVVVTDTVTIRSLGAARRSTSRYYLSRDARWSTSDVRLAGRRTAPRLLPRRSSRGSARVRLPVLVAPGAYRVLACANDLRASRSARRTTCRAASKPLTVVSSPAVALIPPNPAPLPTSSAPPPPASSAPAPAPPEPAPAPRDGTAPVVGLSSPTAGSETEDTTPPLSGPAGTAPNDSSSVTVELWKGSSAPTGTTDRTLTAQVVGGSWSITDWPAGAPPLEEGTWTARSSQSDAAGNTGRSGSVSFGVVAPTLLAAGDIASCDVAGDEATAALLKGRAGTVASLGDHVYGNSTYPEGSLSSYTNCYGPNWGQEKLRTRPAVGNHEYASPKAASYFDYFNGAGQASGPAGPRDRGYYSYDHGAWHIVVLNSNCGELDSGSGCIAGSPQETWLRQDLAAHPNKCTLAYFHHPRFTSGTPGQNSGVKPLWRALYDFNAEVVLNGHAHDYERFAEQDPDGVAGSRPGIREFVVGTGGKSLAEFPTSQPNTEARNNDTFGILQLRLRTTSYEWKFIPEAGKTFTDSGTTDCH